MSRKIELLPCPFCGGDAVLSHEYICGNSFSFIECVKCQSMSGRFVPCRLYNPDEKAAEVWNRRVKV